MAGPTIVTKDLTKVYGDRVAVDSLNIELDAGEVFGLLGPNGAGKTTTILMLLGLVQQTSGLVRVLGMDPARNPLAVKSRVGYLPDAVGFYDRMTGRENLRFTADLNGLDRDLAATWIDELLEEVGLADAADRPAGHYSRGMLQRLGIADALVKNPAILILDEPTTAIDPEGVSETLALIRRLAEEREVTVLLSSHLLHQVQAICDRVAIFVSGRVVKMGAPYDLAAASTGPEVIEVATIEQTDLRSTLEAETYVHDVVPSRLPRRWIVTIDRGSTSQVVARLLEAGAEIGSVRPVTEELDEVYRRYFQKEAQHA